MPSPRTPEQRRAYRARCIAEGRCANCGARRAPDDTATLACARCRVTKNRGSARRYADRRAAAPPAFAVGDPRASFRYGRTRLKDPRRLTLVLDGDTFAALDALCRNFVHSPHYEPYQVSEIIRRALRTLQGREEEVPCRGRLDRRRSSGVHICFLCDADNYALIERQRRRTGCTVPAAVRDLLLHAANRLLFQTPDAEARRLLWEPTP